MLVYQNLHRQEIFRIYANQIICYWRFYWQLFPDSKGGGALRMAKKNILSESMLILRNPTLVCGGWVLRRCGPCELSRFCSWLTSCRCLLIGSSSRSGPSVYKVAATSFYPGSFWVGRGPGRGYKADNPHLSYNITLMWSRKRWTGIFLIY